MALCTKAGPAGDATAWISIGSFRNWPSRLNATRITTRNRGGAAPGAGTPASAQMRFEFGDDVALSFALLSAGVAPTSRLGNTTGT